MPCHAWKVSQLEGSEVAELQRHVHLRLLRAQEQMELASLAAHVNQLNRLLLVAALHRAGHIPFRAAWLEGPQLSPRSGSTIMNSDSWRQLVRCKGRR